MKDKLNQDLEAGDLMLLTFKELLDVNDIKAVFKEYNEATKILTYYPLTDKGLEVAKFDAKVSQSLLHRQAPFKLHLDSIAILKISPDLIDGRLKSLYHQIATLLW